MQINELHRWIITYDAHGMPGALQGVISGNTETHKNGEIVNLHNVFSLDLKTAEAIDGAGNKYKLIGPGVQAVFFQQLEPFEVIKMLDKVEDYDEEDEETN